jgi:hypothetical protein
MKVQRATNLKGISASASLPYTSKIIKAGALLADSKTLLAHWDVATSAKENIERLRRENVFGKASRSRVEDILAIFRQRFLTDESVTRALVVLVREKFAAASLERILYYHATRADRLLHDVVTEVLVPLGEGYHRHRRAGVATAFEAVGGGREDQRPVVGADHRACRTRASFDSPRLPGFSRGYQEAHRPGVPAGRSVRLLDVLPQATPTVWSEVG